MRLAYLDGLRALAAAYVVMFHAMTGFSLQAMTGPWRFLRRPFAYGHEAVAIFIVLSGYCLMLPVVRKQPAPLAVPFVSFMRRRALRILPPYFVALLLSLALLATIAPLRVPNRGNIWDDSLPGLGLGPIGSHLLLVHNWFPGWKVQINGPLWSVATEWQIYFFFPTLLLPVWRRAGAGLALLSAAAVSYAALFLVPIAAEAAVSWYLLLFALGMAAAELGFSPRASVLRLREKLPWGVITAACWAFCVAFTTGAAVLWFRLKPVTDVLVGLATATLLVHLTRCVTDTGSSRSRLLRALESGPLVGLGHFSYSLYLTHLPVLALCSLALAPLQLAPMLSALVLLVGGGAVSLALAYAFFLCVERPFLLRR